MNCLELDLGIGSRVNKEGLPALQEFNILEIYAGAGSLAIALIIMYLDSVSYITTETINYWKGCRSSMFNYPSHT